MAGLGESNRSSYRFFFLSENFEWFHRLSIVFLIYMPWNSEMSLQEVVLRLRTAKRMVQFQFYQGHHHHPLLMMNCSWKKMKVVFPIHSFPHSVLPSRLPLKCQWLKWNLLETPEMKMVRIQEKDSYNIRCKEKIKRL